MHVRVQQPERLPATGLAVCLLLTLLLGIAYARIVPRWNNPDEPAHWNYIVHVATTGQLPILQPGDYPASLLDELKSQHFPPGRSISPIAYESHQPPLYYVLGAAIYKALAGRSMSMALYAIKLMSILAATGLVAVTYLIARELAPEHRYLWVAAAAFVALLPMHLNM